MYLFACFSVRSNVTTNNYTPSRLILTAVFGLLFCANVLAQKAKDVPLFQWPSTQFTNIPVNPEYANHDAVILQDSNAIVVTGAKEEFMYVRIARHFRVKLVNEAGVRRFSSLAVPESFDPMHDYRAVPLHERDKVRRPYYFDVLPIYFEARVLRADGRVEEIGHTKKVQFRRLLVENVMFNAKSFEFNFFELEEGDELEVAYKYEIPFDKNWYRFNAARIFFHSDIPKQNYALNITYKSRMWAEFFGARSDERQEHDGKVTLLWRRQNLPAALGEVGSRPHLDLEHVSYGLNRNSWRHTYVDPESFIRKTSPYWVYFLRQREERALWWRRVARKNLPDRQNVKFNSFLEQTSRSVPDSLPHRKALSVHGKIVDDFDYADDQAYYSGEDQKLERIGDHVEKKIIREISRYNLYSKLYNRFMVPYNTVYFMDKRVGAISKEYPGPIYDQDFAFVFGGNVNRSVYMYPKRHRFGYETDELPFYWEGTTGILVNADLLFSFDFDSLLFVQTPQNEAEANSRKSTVQARINHKSGVVNFDARVALYGQFSTMTRGYYQYAFVDSTINPRYRQRLFDIDATNVNIGVNEMTSKSDQYPYKSNFQFNYTASGLLKHDATSDNYFLNLSQWFNTIYNEDFSAKDRSQPFYADFLHQDEFRYFLTFDGDVEVLNTSELAREIKNSFGSLKIEIEQVNDQTIMLRLLHTVDNERVPAAEVNGVEEIFKALQELNSSSLMFKVAESKGG